MHKFTDQMGRVVKLRDFPPQRIISLVPSQTELLYDLGLDAEVVGITKFCVHPETWFRQKKRVGGTKTVSFEKVQTLDPDLIIGNKEENTREQIELLAAHYPVWMSDVQNLEEALGMIRQIGALTGKSGQAESIARKIEQEFDRLRAVRDGARPRVAYFIWRKPFMAAGRDTFIHTMLEEAGFENVFQEKTRYPEIQLSKLGAAAPEVIFLSSEPFPFAEKHIEEFREACPDAKIKIVDGELFSWYGSRLQHTPGYFQQLRESCLRKD